jgi:hypothetical protein
VNQEQQATEVQSRQVYRRRKGTCRFYPNLRVVCRYPLDPENAPPRWIVEHVSSVSHLIVVPEAMLTSAYELQEEQA